MNKNIEYIVRGNVRGVISQHRDLRRAALSLRRDVVACRKLGGGAYSDCRIERVDGQSLGPGEVMYISEFGYPRPRRKSDHYRY